MAVDPEQFSELMNALQAALLLASRLEPGVRRTVRDAGELRAAVERATVAARQLRPNEQKGETR